MVDHVRGSSIPCSPSPIQANLGFSFTSPASSNPFIFCTYEIRRHAPLGSASNPHIAQSFTESWVRAPLCAKPFRFCTYKNRGGGRGRANQLANKSFPKWNSPPDDNSPAKWSRLPLLCHGGRDEKSCRGIPCAFRLERSCRCCPRRTPTRSAEPPAPSTRRNFQLQLTPAFPHRRKNVLRRSRQIHCQGPRRSRTPRGSRAPHFATGIAAARIPARPRRTAACFGQGTPGARENSEVPHLDPHCRWRTVSHSALTRQRRPRIASHANQGTRLTRALRENIFARAAEIAAPSYGLRQTVWRSLGAGREIRGTRRLARSEFSRGTSNNTRHRSGDNGGEAMKKYC